ncbi:MAG: helix-turn-helix domain-containing protein [Clostridium sp.]|nr:helix-turn-helix domain-containing protein [Clostridium sp.]
MHPLPQAVRDCIGKNIRACREMKFPGRGGQKQCAEAFGVTQQQWSPWESGARTPNSRRLRDIAAFFGVSVEFLIHKADTTGELAAGGRLCPSDQPHTHMYMDMPLPESLAAMHRNRVKAVYTVEMVVSRVEYRPYDPPEKKPKKEFAFSGKPDTYYTPYDGS